MRSVCLKLIQSGLKAQVLHSPGQRPGYKVFTDNAPCKGNSNVPLFFTVALTGRVGRLYPFTQGDALGCGELPLRGAW